MKGIQDAVAEIGAEEGQWMDREEWFVCSLFNDAFSVSQTI
jgi:hypothetical protein